ncbi:MAG: hypothetical protein ACNS61_14015 [Candidatus Wenzhouxiangella sp. M2_3B_020]
MEINYLALILPQAALAVLFIVPPVIVLMSGRVHGSEKLLIAVAVLFTSWLGLLLFLLLTRRERETVRQ